MGKFCEIKIGHENAFFALSVFSNKIFWKIAWDAKAIVFVSLSVLPLFYEEFILNSINVTYFGFNLILDEMTIIMRI